MAASYPNSAEKATVLILINYVKERLKRPEYRIRLVTVPLEVLAHPEHLPLIPRTHIRGLGHRLFCFQCRVLPIRPNFKDFYAVSGDAVRDIQLIEYMNRWPPALQKLCKRLLGALKFDFAKGHVERTQRVFENIS